MTDHRAHDPHDPHDPAVDHWLTQHQQALTSALDDILDTEAGLREILIHSRHDTAVDDFATVLDTEAGLAAILPPTPQAATPTPSTHDTPHDHTRTHELQALSPADRLTLRNHPDVKQAAHDLHRDLDLTRNVVFTRTLDLTRALGHALTRDLDLTRALDAARSLAPARDPDFARYLARARTLDRDLDPDLDRAIHLDIDLDVDHSAGRALDRVLARAAALARDLVIALDRARDCDSVRDPHLDRALDRARDLDRALHLALDPGPDPARTIVEVRTVEVLRAIGLALQRDTPELDANALHTLLDDFTTADLSDADLTDTDLSGVRWSKHGTQWPPVVDIEDLKTRSDETPPGSGTWTIRSGTATIRDLAEL